MYFLETSAKASDNVERLLTEIAQDLLQVIIDLFVTSKNETTNSPIHFLVMYFFLFITFRALLFHFKGF